jgi:hypothetical protein
MSTLFPTHLLDLLMLQPHNPRISHPLPRNIDAAILGLALSTLNPSLDPRDEVEVAIEGGFGG